MQDEDLMGKLKCPAQKQKDFCAQKKSDPKGCFFLGGGWWSLKLMAQDSAGAHACANYECVCALCHYTMAVTLRWAGRETFAN